MSDYRDHLDQAIDALRRRGDAQPDPTFVSNLHTSLQKHLHTQSMRQPFLFHLLERPVLTGAAGLVVIAVVAVGLITRLPGLNTERRTEPRFDKLVVTTPLTQESVTLTPTKSDALGVAGDTRFILRSKTPLETTAVEQALAIAPSVAFSVTATSDTEFEITPRQTLAAGTVYRIALGSTTAGEKRLFSWAVQTKQALTVASTLPRHRATGVPIDTGIEVTFNTDKIDQAERYIRLEPATQGRFEQHGRVLAFVPNERLRPATIYTLTVGKGLPVVGSSVALEQDLVVQFETAQAAQSGERFWGYLSRAFTAVRPNEAPVIEWSVYSEKKPTTPSATVYRFRDSADLIERLTALDTIPRWAYAAQQSSAIATEGLTKVGTYELQSESNALIFPSGFAAGYYLIELPLGSQTLQAQLVVSDLATSLTVSETDSVLWVYDLTTKQPVPGATIRGSDTDVTAATDQRGLAQFATPEFDPASNWNRGYYLVTQGGRETVVPVTARSNAAAIETYPAYVDDRGALTYLWTDRTLYRPNDTLNVWGFFRDRDRPQSEKLTLEVWTWNYVDGFGNYLPLAKAEVETSSYGTFSSNLKLQQLKPGYYTVSLKRGGQTVSSRSVEVRTFKKPAFRIVVTPDRFAAYDGDTVTFSVQTEFFDGTPAPRTALKVDGGETIATTDDDGRATVRRQVSAKRYMNTESLRLVPTEGNEGDIAGEASVLVFPGAVTFTPRTVVKDDQATISLTLRTVELPTTAVPSWTQSTFDGEPVPNSTIRGTVYEVVTTKTKTGTAYDFIEKRVTDVYDHQTHEEQRSDFSGQTDSAGRFQYSFPLDGKSYHVVLTASDSAGRDVEEHTYAYPNRGDYAYGRNDDAFTVRDLGTDKEGPEADNSYPSYRLGDTTELGFQQNGAVVEQTGAFLFLKLQRGIREVSLTDRPRLPFTFQEEDVPNVAFTAVWFDGTGFRTPSTYDTATLDFDETDRALTITVTPDRERYAPGETARLAVRVTDKDGNPVQAMVNLSAIDEALNSIQWDNAPQPMASLYRWVSSGLLQTYVSTAPIRAEVGAERGGGGGDVRKDFRDAVLFTEVETNRNGEASASMKLSDDITSWRVTSQGVSQDLRWAGSSVTMVPVTKPIFGTLTMPDEFVVADHPTILARAFGSGLDAADEVSFLLETPGIGAPQRKTAAAFREVRFPLPTLAAGEQVIRLTVTRGQAKDVLERRIQVRASRLTERRVQFLEAAADLTVTGSATERTTLTFSDAGRGRVKATLQELQWTYGKRLERHLGSRIAADALKELEPERAEVATGFSPLDYQQDDGGVSLVVYGASELPLTAMAASRADLFDASRLRQYLVRMLEDRNASTEQIGWALLGLAHLGEPILPDLDSFLRLPNLTDEDRLRAALAYFALGASDQAATLAQQLLQEQGETQGPYIRLKLGDSPTAIGMNTARFSILAEGLKLPERKSLARFLNENHPPENLFNIERALAMRAAIPQLDAAAASLTYQARGTERTEDLGKGRTATENLTSDELRTFRVISVEGEVGITVATTEPLNLTTTHRDDRLTLNRRYSVVGATDRPAQTGDIVRIDFTRSIGRDIIEEDFLIIDQLPSGLTLLTQPWQAGLSWDRGLCYPIEVNGQRVTCWAGRSSRDPIHYYARVMTPGSYAAEPALIQGLRATDTINYSGGQTIEVR